MRFFTSDLHLGHENIIGFCGRPYDDADHMDMALIANWNETVGPKDTVIVLGDLAMGKIERSLKRAQLLNGHKILVPGNHDRCWPGGRKDWHQWKALYEDAGFQVFIHDAGVALPLFDFRVCHFPPREYNGFPDKFSAWRPPPGSLLHGHVHDAWLRNTVGEDVWVNVGVDVWDYRPVPEEWLREMLSPDYS